MSLSFSWGLPTPPQEILPFNHGARKGNDDGEGFVSDGEVTLVASLVLWDPLP